MHDETARFGRLVKALVAAGAVVAAWVVTAVLPGGVVLKKGGYDLGVFSADGSFGVVSGAPGSLKGARDMAQSAARGGWSVRVGVVDIPLGKLEWGNWRSGRTAVMPWWIVFLVTLAWVILDGWRWLRPRERWDGAICPNCGYDLRATRQRCPECGEADPMRAKAKPPKPGEFSARLVRYLGRRSRGRREGTANATRRSDGEGAS